MDRLTQRLALALRTLKTLQAALREPKTPMNRDASIQRFEYTFEAVWKAAQLYLRVAQNLELASLTAVARAFFQSALLTEDQGRTALSMCRDRNLTVHTYNEELADEIYSRLPAYAVLMEGWLNGISKKASK